MWSTAKHASPESRQDSYSSGCRRGGFFYEPANPPCKVVVRGLYGPAAKFWWADVEQPTKTRGHRTNPQEPARLFFLIGRSRETWLSPPARCHHSWHLRPATPTHLTPKSPSDRPLPITGHLLAPPTTKSLEGRPRRPASTLPLLRPVRRRRGDAQQHSSAPAPEHLASVVSAQLLSQPAG